MNTRRAVLRIALALVSLVVLALVPSALAGKGRPGGGGGHGGGGTTGGETIQLTPLNSTDGLPHYGQKVTFAVSGLTQPWVVAKCWQNGVLVYEQANGIFATSLNQIFTLGPTPLWTGGAADCTAYLQDWSTSKHTTLATTNFHVYA
jgi:hypothetical protein